MKISICLPVKGRSKFLRQALFSILLQGHEDYELVIQDGDEDSPITDDGEVRAVLALFGGRLNLTVGRDGGIFPAVNACLRRATGDILYFFCSDDLICPGALDAVSAAFEAERFGGPFWLYGQTISADVSGRTLGIDGQQETRERLLMRNRLGQPATFWNRRLMELAGAFDLRYRHAADYDLWLRFWGYAEPMFLPQTLGVHRHHDGQNTRVYAAATEAEAQKISTRHRFLGDVIKRARNVREARRRYDAGLAITSAFRDEAGWYGRHA